MENTDNIQEKIFINIILKNEYLVEVLDGLKELNIPECYIGAGALVQSVWNYKSNFPINNEIKDIDIVYFDDRDLSYEAEDNIIQIIKEKFKYIPLKIDIKNQARVHLWYEKNFGYKINPYKSSKEAISTWPATATCTAIRKINNGYEVYAPYSLDDLLNMVVRPNKVLVTKDVYYKKADRWSKIWKDLKVLDW